MRIGISTASIAMKCIAQIPNPIDSPAVNSQRRRRLGSGAARTRVNKSKAVNAAKEATRYETKARLKSYRTGMQSDIGNLLEMNQKLSTGEQPRWRTVG